MYSIFGDYVVSQFRRKTSLFFDANDPSVSDSSTFNSALLTDGVRRLVLELAMAPIVWAEYSVEVPEVEAMLYVEGYFLSERCPKFDVREFEDIVRDALHSFSQKSVDLTDASSVSLISFQLKHRNDATSEVLQWTRQIANRLGGRSVVMSACHNSSANKPGFEVVEIPGEIWTQIDFSPVISASTLQQELLKWCTGLDHIEYRHGQKYAASPVARERFGLNEISFMTRRF